MYKYCIVLAMKIVITTRRQRKVLLLSSVKLQRMQRTWSCWNKRQGAVIILFDFFLLIIKDLLRFSSSYRKDNLTKNPLCCDESGDNDEFVEEKFIVSDLEPSFQTR